MADWLQIKAEYISTASSMRELAEKHGVSESVMRHKAAAEHWKDERTRTTQAQHKKTVQKIVQRASDREADRIVRLMGLGDRAEAALARVLGALEENEKPSAYETKAAIQAIRELQQVYAVAAESSESSDVPRIVNDIREGGGSRRAPEAAEDNEARSLRREAGQTDKRGEPTA